MFLKISCILFYCCLNSVQVHGTKSIDMDYFLSFLRNSNCSTKEGLQYCKELCRETPVLCHKGECYCHQSVVDVLSPVVTSVDVMIAPKVADTPKNEVQINISPQIVSKSNGDAPVIMLTNESNEPAHPVRRHQIAHFCPSLDVARKCIRKCVELGKAAFCGKDHKCYCGHKYGSNDRHDKQDAAEIYKEFSDMYAKYLGNPGPDSEEHDFLKKKELPKRQPKIKQMSEEKLPKTLKKKRILVSDRF